MCFSSLWRTVKTEVKPQNQPGGPSKLSQKWLCLPSSSQFLQLLWLLGQVAAEKRHNQHLRHLLEPPLQQQ